MPDAGTVSFVAGGVMFLGLAVLLATRWRGRLQSRSLAGACLMSVVWCSALSWYPDPNSAPAGLLFLVEVGRGAAWLTFLLLLLAGAEAMPRRLGLVVHGVWITILLAGLLEGVFSPRPSSVEGAGLAFILGGFTLSLAGLVLVEQVYRNTPVARRWAIKYLALGLGGVFAYDLYVFANGLLFRRLDVSLWDARGAINALVVPLIAVAAARNPRLSLDNVVSRRLVFYTTSLVAAGVYLVTMAVGGYYIRIYGGTWGSLIQAVFLFGAGLLLLTTLFSGQVRATLKVFLAKHFYRYKYDYRDEWLRLIRRLFTPGDAAALPDRALRAVADIVESPVAGLWLRQRESYVPSAGDMAGPNSPVEPVGSAMAAFLAERQWIIDLHEYRVQPERYGNLALPGWLLEDPRAWLVMPLIQDDAPLGFMVLGKPRVRHSLTWEDHDLLKTVGRQVAGVLAEHEAAQKLAETRQFEAYNRLTAFIMHDLKNLIAQQSLVVRNAARHKDNPEFVDDAIQTVENSVQRMSRLLGQLKRGAACGPPRTTSLRRVCEALAEQCAQRVPVPVFETAGDAGMVEAVVEPEEFTMVLGHLVQNAQDATSADGTVRVRLERDGLSAVIRIEDSGSGMDERFLRDRLFRPFDTTKGNKGMGIGAYQARELIRAAGGELTVSSRPGEGSVFTVRLPLADAGEAASTHFQESGVGM